MHTTRRWGRAAVASGSLGTLLLAIGCSGVPTQAPQPQATASAGQAGVPVVVSCEPGQRTIVKPTIVNGVAMSQVECVAAEIAQPAANAQPVLTPTGRLRATGRIRAAPRAVALAESDCDAGGRPDDGTPARLLVRWLTPRSCQSPGPRLCAR